MRLKYHVVTACIIVLLTCAAATTGGINRTYDPAINSVTVSSRQENNSSAAPSFLTLHGPAPAVKVIAHGPLIDEKRGFIDAPAVAEKVAGVALSAAEHLHPPKPLALLPVPKNIDDKSAACKKVAEWIKKADAHHAATGKFPDTVVLNTLLEMVKGKADQLARYLRPRAYEEVGMDARISALLSALAARLSEAEMNPIWYAEGRRPEDVLKELSISPESMLSHDDDGVLKDKNTFDKLAQWLLYEYMTYGDDAHKSAVEDLTKLKRTDQEAFYLVTRIELPEGMTANGLHKWFYMKYVGVRYEMSQFWLASGKTPTDAMSLMATRCHGRSSDRYRLSYVDLAEEDKEWYTFCDEFKDRSIIFSSDDKKVEQRKDLAKAITASPEKDEEAANLKEETVDLLMKDKAVDMMMKMYPLSKMSKEDALRQLLENEALAMKVWHRALADIVKKLPSDDAAFFLESLRGIPRYESGAVTMQQHLLNGASEEREKAAFQQREQAIFDLWLESDVKPESVYDIMPFALEKQYDLAVELPKGTFHDRGTNFKQLLKFISQFRRKSKFDDKEVARMLEEKGWTPEELDGLSRGIEEDPEWKNLADLLAKPFEANR